MQAACKKCTNLSSKSSSEGMPSDKVPVVGYSGLDDRSSNRRGFYGTGMYFTDHERKTHTHTRKKSVMQGDVNDGVEGAV